MIVNTRFHILQHASGVDQDLGIVKERGVRIAVGLNPNLPPTFILFPPCASDTMVQFNTGVKVMMGDCRVQVFQDLLLCHVAICKI